MAIFGLKVMPSSFMEPSISFALVLAALMPPSRLPTMPVTEPLLSSRFIPSDIPAAISSTALRTRSFPAAMPWVIRSIISGI